MNIVTDIFRTLLIATIALYALGWLAFASMLIRLVFLGLLGRVEVSHAAQHSKLQNLKNS